MQLLPKKKKEKKKKEDKKKEMKRITCFSASRRCVCCETLPTTLSGQAARPCRRLHVIAQAEDRPQMPVLGYDVFVAISGSIKKSSLISRGQ
jgi:hypothetical protein